MEADDDDDDDDGDHDDDGHDGVDAADDPCKVNMNVATTTDQHSGPAIMMVVVVVVVVVAVVVAAAVVVVAVTLDSHHALPDIVNITSSRVDAAPAAAIADAAEQLGSTEVVVPAEAVAKKRLDAPLLATFLGCPLVIVPE
eukprot:s808_g5.t1